MKMRVLVCLLAAAFIWLAGWHLNDLLFAIGVHPYPAGTPWTYQLWSGFIPALTILSLLGSLGGAYHLHNCHFDTCWRLGKHRIGGTPWCTMHVGYARAETTDSDRLDRIISLLEVANAGYTAPPQG